MPTTNQQILWAQPSWEHTGAHSAFAPFSREVTAILPPGSVRLIDGRLLKTRQLEVWKNRFRRLLGRPLVKSEWVIAREGGVPFYRESSWAIERKVSQIVGETNPRAVVLAAMEDQLFFLAKEKRKWQRTRLVGFSHQPPAWWKLHHARPDLAGALDRLVIVAESARSYWEQYIDPRRIVMMLHGVDTDFFSPSTNDEKLSTHGGALHAVFSGQWLRDFETLAAVVARVDELDLPVRFELVVPRFARNTAACYQLAMSKRVRWHAHLSDEELRAVYQQADILLLPLIDSTANNGLLEGMACGIPVIVTDVGGVRDYAKNNFAHLVAPGDAAEIVQLLKHYVENKAHLAIRGAAARAHVEQNLSWKQVAEGFVGILTGLDGDHQPVHFGARTGNG